MIDPMEDADTTPPRANGKRGGLEERVRKLEAAVGELRDSVPTEEAVADRVIARLGNMAGANRILAGPVDAEFIPADVAPLANPAPPPPDAVPSGAVLRPPVVPPDPAKRTWFVLQLWSELRLMVRMYFDPQYRVSRTAQFAVPAVIGLFALNYFLFSVWFSIAVISPITERVVGVLLGVFLYKVLTREMVRYREVLDYMAKQPVR